MFSRKTNVALSLLLIALVVLAGCGPRAGRVDPKAVGTGDVVIDLPAIYVDFDANGTPTIGGQTIEQLGVQLGQALPAIPSLPADQITLLTNFNIQHLQINNSPKGLGLLVNGMQIPSLGWSPDQLSATVETLSNFGIPIPPDLAGILPMLGNVGVGVVVRFPIKDSAALIPLVVEGGMSAPAESVAAQKQFLDAVGEPPLVKFDVDYNADGSWTVDGKGPNEYAQAIPGFKWDGLNMEPGRLKGLVDLGVKNFTISTNKDGIFVAINGKTLPNITWANGEIEHTLVLAEQLGLLDLAANAVPNLTDILNQIKAGLPAAQASNFSMTINLPTK